MGLVRSTIAASLLALLVGALVGPSLAAAAEGDGLDTFRSAIEAEGFECSTLDDLVMCQRTRAYDEWQLTTDSVTATAIGSGSSSMIWASLLGGGQPWTPEFDRIAATLIAAHGPADLDLITGLIEVRKDMRGRDEGRGTDCWYWVESGGNVIEGLEDRYLAMDIYPPIVDGGFPEPSGLFPSPEAPALPSPEPIASEAPIVAAPTQIPPTEPTPGVPASDGSVTTPAFTSAIPTPAQVVVDPGVIAASALLTLVIVLLIPFPGALFNSTLEANHDEIRGWFRLPRRSAGDEAPEASDPADTRRDPWASPAGIVGFLLVSALLYAFLDPGFGSEPSSLPMYVGTLLGLGAVTVVAIAVPRLVGAGRGRPRALPLTLVVGLACVVVSRLTGFVPGYLYGLIVAVELTRALGPQAEGRLAALATALLLGISGLAWLALAVVPADGGLVTATVSTALAALLVAGLEGVVFGLVPLRFLPGAAIWASSRAAWAALYAIGVFGFLHVLLDPDGGYLASSAQTPLATIVALLLGFGVASVLFWGYFRFRPAPGVSTPP
jgi:F0F1-type ATP synthase assembly protein I